MNSLNFGPAEMVRVDFDQAQAIVLPVAFDESCSWKKGAADGPRALIESSYYLEDYNCELDYQLQAVHTLAELRPKNASELIETVYQTNRKIIAANKLAVTLGGEHTVSLGAIRAHCERWPEVTVLQFDAHADRRDSYEGSKFSHACAMARAMEYTQHIVSVGIRAIAREELAFLKAADTFYAADIVGQDITKQLLGRLSDEVYITFDLDAFDPSIMPATGTPEPGGLGWYEVINLIRAVAQNRRIVGFDVVELAPIQELHAPQFLAAQLVYNMLGYILQNKISL